MDGLGTRGGALARSGDLAVFHREFQISQGKPPFPINTLLRRGGCGKVSKGSAVLGFADKDPRDLLRFGGTQSVDCCQSPRNMTLLVLLGCVRLGPGSRLVCKARNQVLADDV